MTVPIPVLLFSIAVMGLSAPAAAQTNQLGEVTQYKSAQMRAYSADGQPAGLVSAADLPALPAPIREMRGRLIGLDRRGGERVFLRGIELEFRLSDSANSCSATTGGARQAGQANGSTRAGGGNSQDCRVTARP